MPDSVLFDGSTSRIVLGKGAVVGAARTVAVVCKYVATTPDIMTLVGHDAAQNRFGAWIGGTRAANWDGTQDDDAPSGSLAAIDTWQILVYTRSTGQGRHHRYNGTAWRHDDGAAAASTDWSIASTLMLGREGSGIGGEYWNGNLLIFGWKNADTTDLGVEVLANGYQAWKDFGFVEGVRLDALSGLSTFVAGGTMAESSRVGTTLDTGDVPAWWNDTLGPPPQIIRPDADTVTTGWTTTPLFSKINDQSDATVITSTLA